MALYAIGDLHLSTAAAKPMDIFKGWERHVERLTENWRRLVCDNDTVVLAGDTSWGMTLADALPDFKLIDALPGKQKLILKGNHDYWWTSASKMNRLFAETGLTTLKILHNNAYEAEGFRICGSRGWLFENGEPHDAKLVNREACRIEASLAAAQALFGEPLLFLHYPPVYAGQETPEFLALMRQYGIKRCYYGHIHGAGHRQAVQGYYCGTVYHMISADYLGFSPLRIEKSPELSDCS